MISTIARILQVANPHDIPLPSIGERPIYAGRFDMEKRKAERVEATACTSRHLARAMASTGSV